MMMQMTNDLLTNFADVTQAARVTILHEDLPTALCAKALFDCVAPQLDGAELELDFWRFDALRDAALRADSARASQSSAVVVFSIRDRRTLPPEIKEWLLNWISGRGEHPCAFAVLTPRPNDDSPLLRHLRRTAEKAGADFFCEVCDFSRNQPSRFSMELPAGTLFESPKRTDFWRA